MTATNTTYFSDIHIPKPPIVFARHETFAVRFNWLKKGVKAFIEDKNIFQSENAPVILGVGKNMVKSIKYWCVAFKLINEQQDALTDFANTLFESAPYLQDNASLWLLHWNLLKSPCLATAWEYVFNHLSKQRFTSQDILEGIKHYLNQSKGNIKISDSSIIKDVLCLLRMYCKEEKYRTIMLL